jgi:hypothetical protein
MLFGTSMTPITVRSLDMAFMLSSVGFLAEFVKR